MPSGSYWQAYVLCPYYVSDNGRDKIICEGLVPGSNIQNYFHVKEDYLTQIEKFCCKSYKTCEIFSAMKTKYDEE